MKKAALICSILLFSIIAVLAVSCGGGGGGAIASTGGNNAGKRGFGGGSGSEGVKVFVNGTQVAGSNSESSSGEAENASTASYSAGIMSLDWSTMDLKLWVNGQLYFNQTLNKGDKFSIAGLKFGDSVRAEGNFYTSDGTTYLITGGIPSVQNGSKLSMYVTYTFECDASNLPNNVYVPLALTGTYTAETGAALPAIQCLDGRTVLGWVVKNTGLPSDGKVWKSIPAGTTGNLELELVETKSLGGQQIFDVSGKTITKLTPYGKTLSSIKIPEGVEKIEYDGLGSEDIFEDADCTSVTLPSTLKTIGNEAFASSKLTSITIPANVESIGNMAFTRCTRLVSVNFAPGSKLTSIGNSAFDDCPSLTAITIPADVGTIGNRAFKNCTNLGRVEFAGNKIEMLEQNAFENTKITSIVIPEGVKVIRNECFMNCDSLASVSLPESLLDIQEKAFLSCRKLSGLTIPAGVISLGDMAFKDCGKDTAGQRFTITMRRSTPPSFGTDMFDGIVNLSIRVPSAGVGNYTGSPWSGFTIAGY